MITGIKINKVEARRDSESEIIGLNINITIDSLNVKNNQIEIGFTYSAAYTEGVGELKMSGILYATEEAKLAKEISDKWVKEKRLPDAYAEMVLNALNYACGTNGVFAVRIVNLTPPIVPPKITLNPQPPQQPKK
ncbi:MAG: hypothetical protein QXN37_02385 [Candidatus Anstonellaceae archaeon]